MQRLAVCLPVVALVLAGCAGAPHIGSGPGAERSAGPTAAPAARPEPDGPPADPPPNLAAVPDAEPALEPIRIGGPNKPYAIDGTTYTPLLRDEPFVQRGLASWYGRKFHGLPTASGERYDMYAMSAAHPTLPIPSYARIRNPANGRVVVVRINDRGPFHSSRVIDLTYTAALKLDLLRGVAPVEVQHVTGDEIREALQRRKAGVELAKGEPASSADAFWLQFGAFRASEGASVLRDRIAAEQPWLAPLLAVFHTPPFHRLQAGPYPDREAAREAAERLRPAGIATLIVARPP